MVQYLSQEWMDETRALAAGQPERPGATARLQWNVTAGPDGDIKYWWRLEDGHLLESGLGAVDAPDVTLTLSYEDSVKISRGEFDANAAFMQGRLKAAGDMGRFMQLLPLTNSTEYKALQSEIRGITEY